MHNGYHIPVAWDLVLLRSAINYRYSYLSIRQVRIGKKAFNHPVSSVPKDYTFEALKKDGRRKGKQTIGSTKTGDFPFLVRSLDSLMKW